MARWPEKQKEDSVGSAPPTRVAPPFDPARPYTDAIEKQQKYWVQNGWLYTRGAARPVREVK